MPTIDEQEARALVAPHLVKFDSIYRRAWESWLKNPVAARMQDKRVRANVIWNDAVAEAKVMFDGDGEVRFDEKGQWKGLLVGNRLFVRLKKGTAALLSRNVKTKANEAFHDQNRDLFGGIARCELLYVLSEDETELERVVVVQRHKKAVVWSIDALGDFDDGQMIIPFAPVPPGSGGGGSVADRVVKPKKNGENENGTRRDAAAGGGLST
ncbi:hypothetical protein [Cupriavidus taiwanensis]|uniref:hypothetical protein n=1 Tax=Cupriavidus taiwanensis TaxID=164546 RepID=UPI0011C025AC|nr:hypothetical protein [Cupriavidus taiwanensis]